MKTTDGTNKTMRKKKIASDHLIEKTLDERYLVRELRNPYNIPQNSRFHPNGYPCYCREVATLVMCQKKLHAVRMKKKISDDY
ncbi:hypothetical protein OROGR_010133 [Orobanche gracilis]